MLRHQTDRGVIHEARAEDMYPLLGSVQLVISDGPYFLGLAEWDKGRPEDAAEWYRPHIAAWGRICAPSASVYVWGTSASWAAVHPEMLAAGWDFRGLAIWHKTNAQQQKAVEGVRMWPDMTEVAGLYQRGPDWSRLIREAAAACPDSRAEVCRCIGIDSRLLQFWEEGERFPSWLLWRKAWEVLRGPFAVLGPGTETYRMQASQGMRCATDAETRAEWEAFRPPFTLPAGTTNVWPHPIVAGSERLRDRDGKPLHKCQKPLALIKRMILASTRPGGLVLSPFGGTCREAVAIESMSPAEARRYVCVELNQDGVDYLAPVIEELEAARSQGHLF